MMMFWISCLLIGSISCSPLPKEYGSEAAPAAASEPLEVPLPYRPGSWNRWVSSIGSSSPKPSLPNPTSETGASASAVPGSSSSRYTGGSDFNSGYLSVRDEAYKIPEVSYYGAYAASDPSGYGTASGIYTGGYASSASGYGGSAPSGSYASPPSGYDGSAASGTYTGGYASSASGYDGSAPSGSYTGGYASPPSGYDGSAPSGSYTGGYASPPSGYYGSAPSGSYTGGYASPPSGYDGSAPSGSYTGGYASSDSGYAGSSSYGYVGPQDEASSGSATNTGAGLETPEPVFSDVSDLEPVYSFSSRSGYQRGREVFSQTRYTPGEPAPRVMPVSRRISKTPTQSDSAGAPAKGGF
ncbi:prisilkin-39-like [Seriola aureovittata]|uniref:prisilkin-39-like n=1 Tax=Seriola aureovittata TaxID=2871759 RepID=UPI0024BE8B5A|nr:prisilkin-39-like [Seriola aureovittata]